MVTSLNRVMRVFALLVSVVEIRLKSRVELKNVVIINWREIIYLNQLSLIEIIILYYS